MKLLIVAHSIPAAILLTGYMNFTQGTGYTWKVTGPGRCPVYAPAGAEEGTYHRIRQVAEAFLAGFGQWPNEGNAPAPVQETPNA